MVMKTNILIIGAGIIGVMTARFLIEKGVKDILLVEKNYPGSGGSFRCATGIRASFTSPEHVEMMKRSIELWPVLSEKHGFTYRRDGYIWLLSEEKHVDMFKKIVEFHHRYGVPTKIVTPEEIKDMVPTINTENLLAGVYDPLAGKADCFKALLNTLEYVKSRGARILTRTSVDKIIVENDKARAVKTDKGVIEAEKIVVAAGYGSKHILKNSGIDVPLENLPKHALITEAYKPLFKPLLIDWSTASYIIQVIHGGFLIGANIKEEPDTIPRNRIEYLFLAIKTWSKYFKWLPYTRILRYWTGYYVMTPDHHPIIGPHPRIGNLYISTGYSGHGFMMAPAAGEVMSQYILGEKLSVPIAENLGLERFEKGEYVKEIAIFG